MRAAMKFAVLVALGMALAAPGARAAAAPSLVEFEMMTWTEVRDALAAGKTTALIYTGGIEQRGPQNANGGHNLMGKAFVKAIAERLGNAIAMPVLPFTPDEANPKFPGTIGLTDATFAIVLEEIAEQSIINGFKNVVLMGDSGSGQPTIYAAVAKKLDDKYAAKGVRVFYGDDIYRKANGEFGRMLVAEGYPATAHGGITDTSTMMYLDPEHKWVRREQLPNTQGDPVLAPGEKRPAGYKSAGNGIVGDARRSSEEIGKRRFEYKVAAAVKQIEGFIPPKK